MSGFITTMFVSSSTSNLHTSFPAKPKPLQPVFTFAQSQSCMNLSASVPERTEHTYNDDTWNERFGGWIESLALARPPLTYKSPLQRIGEALRTTQLGWTSQVALSNVDTQSGAPQPEHELLVAAHSTNQPPSQENNPTRDYPNYSYKLLPNGTGSPTCSDPKRHRTGRSGRRDHDVKGIGTILRPPSMGQIDPPRNNGYFRGPSLLASFLSSNPRNRAPFKAPKTNRGTSSWQLKQYAEATLGSGSLRKAVKLPEGEDKDEWLAVNVVDFYNQINLLYGSITEFCSPQSCPEMKATDEFEYLWQDNENYKKPTKMPAPEYIEHLMAWVQSNIDNEQMFPSRIGVPFPKTFPALLRNMFKRLYRVYAHIYCHHYHVVIELGLEPHLNTSFKHYVLFIDEHGLANGSKDFWGPLGDLVESMLKSD